MHVKMQKATWQPPVINYCQLCKAIVGQVSRMLLLEGRVSVSSRGCCAHEFGHNQFMSVYPCPINECVSEPLPIHGKECDVVGSLHICTLSVT